MLLFCAGVSYAQSNKEYIEKMAAEQSLVMQSEGWKATAAGMPLKFQLLNRFNMEQQTDGDGSQKYFLMEGRAEDANLQTAKVRAIKNARKNIILAVDDSDDNSGSTLDIGSCKEVVSVYKPAGDGKFEVMVVLACPWENIQKGKAKQAAAKRPQTPVKQHNAIESSYTL